MKFSIKKNPFTIALTELSNAVSSNSPQPSLRGIKIDIHSNELVLTSSNADISIQKKIEKSNDNQLNIQEEGKLLIEAKYLLEIVRKIDSDKIYIESIDGTYTQFKGNKALFKINGMAVRQYPEIDFSQPNLEIELDKDTFLDLIDQTIFACSKQEMKPVLMGVNFELKNNQLVCTATDSYRLARKVVDLESSNQFNVTIPEKSLSAMKNTILQNAKEIVSFAVDRSKVQIRTQNMIFQSRILDGDYPATAQLIPTQFIAELEISRYDLKNAIDRTSFLRSEDVKENRLQLIDNQAILTSRSQEIGESREELSAQHSGEDLDISFDGAYVVEALRGLHGERVLVQFKGVMKPFILTSKDDSSTIQLVLPLKSNH
ncbi:MULTISPECIES: DNA polymerase III subunit beta [Terrabacteria group]|uniref:DNA polymerase III subunit beta n=1 Tax=Bacillati TaxID=1783272 RepID=UPI001C6DF8F7|nr:MULTISPECIES: DNA polymerase III subunit beta [Terrabacteria group]MBW9212503.1 DNA polymerase III subunit beta [Trueperella sp. zg.1013]